MPEPAGWAASPSTLGAAHPLTTPTHGRTQKSKNRNAIQSLSVTRPDIKVRGICGHGLTSWDWEMCYQTSFSMFLTGLEHLWVLSTFSPGGPSPPLLALLPFLVLSAWFWVQRFVCLHFPTLCRQLHVEPNSWYCHLSNPRISLPLLSPKPNPLPPNMT